MTRRTSPELNEKAFRMYFDEGKNYDEIGIVSTGHMSKIVKGVMAIYPELDQLRKLNLATIKYNVNQDAVFQTVPFKLKLDSLGLQLEDVQTCTDILSICGKNAKKVLETTFQLVFSELAAGRSLEQTLEDYASKVKLINDYDWKIEESRGTIRELIEEETRRRKSLSHVATLEFIDNETKKANVSPGWFALKIDSDKELERLGFDPDTANILGQELAKMKPRALSPSEASKIIVELLNKYGDLEAAINERERRKESLGLDLLGLSGERDRQRERFAKQKKLADIWERKASELEKRHASRERELENQYQTERVTREEILRATEAREILELKTRVDGLKTKIVDVEETIQKNKGKIESADAIFAFLGQSPSVILTDKQLKLLIDALSDALQLREQQRGKEVEG